MIDVVVLGENSIFILNDHQGKIRYQKRFSFAPSCLITYHLRQPGSDLCLEAGEDIDEVIDNAERKGL